MEHELHPRVFRLLGLLLLAFCCLAGCCVYFAIKAQNQSYQVQTYAASAYKSSSGGGGAGACGCRAGRGQDLLRSRKASLGGSGMAHRRGVMAAGWLRLLRALPRGAGDARHRQNPL